MIALFASMLLLGVQAAPADAAASGDIVVVGERLRRLRLATDIQDGRMHGCTVRVSSGDAGIDRAACEATGACIAEGVQQSEPLADCVDARVIAFVRRRG